MIFWVLVCLASLAVVVAFVWWFIDDGIGMACISAFLTAIVSLVVGGVILWLLMWIPAQEVRADDYQLRALATSYSTSGSFFLGTGYIGSERTLNFIRSQDGYSKLDYALAADSYIYEDADKPTFTEYIWRYDNPWVLPWTYVTGYSYDFHVPAGSVLENYDITN